MSQAQQLNEGDRVRFVGHIMHEAPPILKGEKGAAGTIEDGGYGDLYRMRLDKTGTTVQIHAMQVERVDGKPVCRVCGCTNDYPCTRRTKASNWTCGWAEDDLCTACTPDAAPGWVHRSAKAIEDGDDMLRSSLGGF
jgi:hypothetical protein